VKHYKVLVFDIDDTLIDEQPSVRAAVAETSRAQNQKLPWKKYVAIETKFWMDYRDGKLLVPAIYDNGDLDQFGRSRREFVRAARFIKFFDGVDLARAYELLEVYENKLRENPTALSGAKTILKYLSAKYKLVAATDGVYEIAKIKLEKSGLAKYVAEIYAPLNTGATKPKPEFFTPIFAKYGNRLSNYLIIGNLLNSDIKLANGLGIDSVLFNSGGG